MKPTRTRKRTNIRNERLVALFLLGMLLFNYPVLSLFNAPTLVLGIPLLYLYLFLAWAGVILVAALVIHRSTEGG
jgi:TRAP-type C4-dicarboxylate transport system permease small subunit